MQECYDDAAQCGCRTVLHSLMIATSNCGDPMSGQQEEASASNTARTPEKPIDLRADETLTDLFDRMDREAFRRSLELRDSRLLNHGARRR